MTLKTWADLSRGALLVTHLLALSRDLQTLSFYSPCDIWVWLLRLLQWVLLLWRSVPEDWDHAQSRASMGESQWNRAGALITWWTSGSNYTWSWLYLRLSSYKRKAILYFCLSHIRVDFLLQATWRIFIVRGLGIWAINPPTPFCLKEKS